MAVGGMLTMRVMDMDGKLIKCECGNKPRIGWVVKGDCLIGFMAICEKCGKRTDICDTDKQAIEAWNAERQTK